MPDVRPRSVVATDETALAERGPPVNWRWVAMQFADRRAAAVLDSELVVRLFSLGLERLLGWSREEIEGRGWIKALVPPEHRRLMEARLERALARTTPIFDCYVWTKSRRILVLSLKSALLGKGTRAALCLTVTRSSSIAPPADESDDDFVYEVDTSGPGFGTLQSLTLSSARPNGRCHAVLHGSDRPCDDCPLLHPTANPWPRSVTRRLPGPREVFEVITATKSGAERARIRARRISGSTIASIHEAKVDALSREAQLSEREREILNYLLMGRSLVDIALLMKVSLRTVKFHQSNLLNKLGADSRSDLVRLIL